MNPTPPGTLKKKIIWTILPAVLWYGSTELRPQVIQPWCLKTPSSCTAEAVPAVDRISLGMENSDADGYSYITQNLSGLVAGTAPFLWATGQAALLRVTPTAAVVTALSDLLTLVQIALWNGTATEISHLISQRPRPFVFSDPQGRGHIPHHYTSFYSGHTSFAAASTLGASLLLLYRGASTPLLVIYFLLSEVLILSTAYFRIMAGRHFLTDVLAGAIAGSLFAFLIIRGKRQSENW